MEKKDHLFQKHTVILQIINPKLPQQWLAWIFHNLPPQVWKWTPAWIFPTSEYRLSKKNKLEQYYDTSVTSHLRTGMYPVI
jgi:hypothetical protein